MPLNQIRRANLIWFEDHSRTVAESSVGGCRVSKRRICAADRRAGKCVRRVRERPWNGTCVARSTRVEGWLARRTLRRLRWWANAMTGAEASISPPALPRWFGPRASPDDPAVSALIDRVARGARWADIGGGFNLNLRIDAEPPVVLRVHRPWVRRGRVAGLRRLRERLQRTHVHVARPIPISGSDAMRVADRWAEIEEFIDHVQPPAGEDSYVRLFEELGRLHTALKAVWEPSPPEPLDDHRTLGQLRYSVGVTRRRLGPRSEPVVRRMRQLTGELSKLRKEVELPCAPISWGLQTGQRGRTVRRLMGHLRPGFREGQGAAVRHRGQPAPRRTERRIARAATTARRLRKHGSGTADSRRAPLAPRGSSPRTPALGCHRRARRRRHPRGRERNDRRRGLVVAPG